jgi:hypothetical protein
MHVDFILVWESLTGVVLVHLLRSCGPRGGPRAITLVNFSELP